MSQLLVVMAWSVLCCCCGVLQMLHLNHVGVAAEPKSGSHLLQL